MKGRGYLGLLGGLVLSESVPPALGNGVLKICLTTPTILYTDTTTRKWGGAVNKGAREDERLQFKRDL